MNNKVFISFKLQTFSLALSGVLLLNSAIALKLFDGGDFNSAISAISALFLLFPQLIHIVWKDFTSGRRHMNELVLIAVIAAAARGDAPGLLTAGLIAFFLLIGILIENRSATGAKISLEQIAKMTKGTARRVNSDGSEEELEPNQLAINDIIRLRPGELVMADGEIVSGFSSFQESNITGESLPVDKTINDKVFAGTLNLSGVVEIKVLKIGSETAIGKVKELILAAEQTRPEFIRMIDSYAQYYTPLVLMIAFFVWIAFDHDLDRVVAVLVASCPIALVLSTPSAAVAALSAAARLGVLIKNVKDIESMSNISAFIFDKTGTLTTGILEVVELAPNDQVTTEELLLAAAIAEQHSNHPVAQAVCKLAQQVKLKIPETTDSHEIPGRGVSCVYESQTIFVGNLKWMGENGADENDFQGYSDDANAGMSLLFVLKDKKTLGWLALRDQVRHDAAETIKNLKNLFQAEIAMVTGDRTPVAETIAKELSIQNFHGDCKPADKIIHVQEIKNQGHHVVFIGDGVNDGPALAASDIGIAMGAAGSDLAIETATMALMNNELNRLIFLKKLSVSYRKIMIQNFILGILFIIGGMVGGIFAVGAMSSTGSGHFGAVLSASLQVISAIAVVMNSARLIRAGEEF